ncbi:sulfurtransferase complex subunit TusC [Limnobaculum zhutongyuii]|uniref:Sulfurtransferase complex subunit TusC n=1 Tax=Limnobaculum zhutongyuii TaxID=2498113 RepID=A0A411WPV2_9GAMM|nr:sulfurtransferase complex subunit TusC [Limnobaculum zhutongyuii]QBH98222.1 sulfurtransferase complex subunit TusC [Limnobaculum zhutongyuii]TQS89881.1 sulfurtransferase complex subunit TusC [Limnobaculum zhutongyuii]
MKKIAFVFTHVPHGSSGGREGLDAVLATSALTEEIGLLFLSDGVFQLLPEQQPDQILMRNYIATFGVLALYNIEQCFVCTDSMFERGIDQDTVLVIDAIRLNQQQMHERLSGYDVVLTF